MNDLHFTCKFTLAATRQTMSADPRSSPSSGENDLHFACNFTLSAISIAAVQAKAWSTDKVRRPALPRRAIKRRQLPRVAIPPLRGRQLACNIAATRDGEISRRVGGDS
jgi:hypothetical protein